MDDIAIRVEGLGKRFRLRHSGGGPRYRTFREDLLGLPGRLLAGLRGRRDETEEFWALKEVSFEVKRGEVLGIIGRNGAGKSTLLKVLSRIMDPTCGEATVHGRIGSLMEVGTGFHPELTGRENVFLSGALLGMRRYEVRRCFDEIVAFAGVEKFLDTPCKHYSSGMYTRLGFAVAAHLDAEILLVDEVLAVGDAEFQRKCMGKMGELAAGGRTVVFVSHNMGALARLCSSGLLLGNGTVEHSGAIADCVRHYLANLALTTTSQSVEREGFRLDAMFVAGPDGVPKTGFSNHEEVGVVIRYSQAATMPGLRVGFDLISSESGEAVFRSFDDDIEDRPRDAGQYALLARIPSNLLRAGDYLAVLTAGVHDSFWISHDEVACPFRIENIDGVNARRNDRRPGAIAPKIQWNLIRQ